MKEVYIMYTQNYDKELNMVYGYGKVNGYIGKDREVIGNIIFNFYNMHTFEPNNSNWQRANIISDDEVYLMETLLKSDFEFEMGTSIATIEKISLFNDPWDTELRKSVVQEFLDYCDYMMVNYVATVAADHQSERSKTDNIISFPKYKMYETLGFMTLGGGMKNRPVLLKNLNLL
ncbi:hypothetical protein P5G51_014475 [Virgibacillus sp. 179-BFC.A HS]|uniref:Uncharacterized protein n=1 Tax=Tigheibacillus jepli TaxID=3035914 RepID=A0ABU5CKI4_9BACI|nr:hypothetical protein [Virgibacillus sp. 179-BFC.A HS]MDY0406436.1 hypothetical protein [Virgibacillus sp. 179-BFC.A HS]